MFSLRFIADFYYYNQYWELNEYVSNNSKVQCRKDLIVSKVVSFHSKSMSSYQAHYGIFRLSDQKQVVLFPEIGWVKLFLSLTRLQC